jgi:hypothetical protein
MLWTPGNVQVTDWIVLTTQPPLRACKRGVMLHNLQLHQAESGRVTFLRRCHHSPSEHRC